MRSYFTKAGGNLGQTGSVSHGFDRLGEISYPVGAGSADDVMMAAIEAGAEDVESDEDGHWVYCKVEDLATVSDALERFWGNRPSRSWSGARRRAPRWTWRPPRS